MFIGDQDVTNVHQLALSDDQQTVATCGDSFFLWNLKLPVSTSLRDELRDGHADNVFRTFVFLGDGNRLVTASFDMTAKVWNALTCEEIHTIRFRDVIPDAVSYCAQLNRFACALGNDKIQVFDADNFSPVGSTIDGAHFLIAYSPSKRIILLQQSLLLLTK